MSWLRGFGTSSITDTFGGGSGGSSNTAPSKTFYLPPNPILPLPLDVCPIVHLLGEHGRLRLGADFAAGYFGFFRGGLGLSIRGDASLELDGYLGGGVGLGLVGGAGLGLDTAGNTAHGFQANATHEVCASGGFIGTVGACAPSSSVSSPNVDWAGISGGFSGGVGLKAGAAAGSTKSGNLAYRTPGVC